MNNSDRKLRIGIAGASGLMGMQLLQLLSRHPGVGSLAPCSRRFAGKLIVQVYPALKGSLGEMRFQRPDADTLASCDTLFCALPQGKTVAVIEAIDRLGRDVAVIDLGSDFRIQDAELYRKVQGKDHPAPELLRRFVQVVPEIDGPRCRSSRWLALPGCVSTAALLGLYPLLKEGLVAAPFINIDAKVGSTGAGSSRTGNAQMHYLLGRGARSSAAGEHRHAWELTDYCRPHAAGLSFHVNTFSVDMARGSPAPPISRPAAGRLSRPSTASTAAITPAARVSVSCGSTKGATASRTRSFWWAATSATSVSRSTPNSARALSLPPSTTLSGAAPGRRSRSSISRTASTGTAPSRPAPHFP